MKTIPLVLAGGRGERFWPLSRASRPKQLLKLTSNISMIEETLVRVGTVSSAGVKPLVITGRECFAGLHRTLARRFAYDCIVEPQGKNTAPAVGLAAALMRKRHGDVVMLVVSADHAIAPLSSYRKAVRAAVNLAQATDSLVVFGIRPSRPDTGYGYINIGKMISNKGGVPCYEVKRFVEKPTQPVARRYVASGKYLWNSGMFVWKASVVLDEFRRHMPAMHEEIIMAEKSGFSKRSLETYYKNCARESIDYGIMEKSSRIAAVCGTFFWDDIGSWEAMTRVHEKNKDGSVAVGPGIFETGNSDSIIYNASNRAIAAIGLDRTVLVVTSDAVFAIARPLLPDLKKYLSLMKEKKFLKELF
jgi:mannose-1-phosphate guanylyltransferase